MRRKFWKTRRNQRTWPASIFCVATDCEFMVFFLFSRARKPKTANPNKAPAKTAVQEFLKNLCSPEKHDEMGYRLDQESRLEVMSEYKSKQEENARDGRTAYFVEPDTYIYVLKQPLCLKYDQNKLSRI